MKICRQGNGHYIDGLNNQDFYYMEENLKLLTDGCSAGLFSEVGTRLFVQQFSRLDNRFSIDKFESNVEKAFSKICSIAPSSSEEKIYFITNNMLFTILACFELEDKFIVKFIGDGYIITVNNQNMVSYIRLSYGKKPPYYAYNKLDTQDYDKKLKFKTFEFPKAIFKKVGIASDGIQPIAEKKIDVDFDPYIIGIDGKYKPEGIINTYKSSFFDDVTILI